MTTADSFAFEKAQDHQASLTGAQVRNLVVTSPDAPLIWIAVVLALWAGAVAIWGGLALYLPAVAVAPLVIGLLVGLTRG